MTPDLRAENLRRLLVWLIKKQLARKQSVIVLEDTHWMDENSWRLLVDVIRLDEAVLIIGSCRKHAFQSVARQLTAHSIDYHRLSLRPLSRKHTINLVCNRLNQPHVSDWLAQVIIDTTAGNPFFVDEICHVIKKDSESIKIDQAYAATLPKVLESAVLSRIDHLTTDDQLLVKLASVIGTSFRLDLLKALAPKSLNVAVSIQRLLSLQLLKSSTATIRGFEFRHKIIRDLVYDSLLTEQKRETHAALARCLEVDLVSADSVRLPLILHHWRCAEDVEKIVAYLDQVAALRLRQFDNDAAITLLMECLSLAKQREPSVDNAKQAVCQLLLGDAHVGKGLMEAARKSYEQGLSFLNHALPKHAAELTASLVWQIAKQCWTRLTGAPSTETASLATWQSKARWQHFELVARAYENLMRIYYFAGEKARLVHVALKATNLAEALGDCTPPLAANYASLGAMCFLTKFKSQAEHYLNRASEIAKLYNEANVSTTVYLVEGLYRTIIGHWLEAKSSFVVGLDIARLVGDKKRWCELAISLETISGPWLLTPAFSDIRSWDELVHDIWQIGHDRKDPHVIGCAVLGSLRGYRVLGRPQQITERIEEIKALLDSGAQELELIHKVEGCAHVASVELEKGNLVSGEQWLQRCEDFLPTLNPGLKFRTLPAISCLFDARLRQIVVTGSRRQHCPPVALARRVLRKLNRFSRIYPVGRPETLRCQGDLCAVIGHPKRAIRYWRRSLQEAIRFRVGMNTVQAAERLKRAGYDGGVLRNKSLADSLPLSDDVIAIAEQSLCSSVIDYIPFQQFGSV
jgi:tetratricopeptide (TPR) repeat protein